MKDQELSKENIAELITSKNPILLDIGCYDGKDALELTNIIENSTAHCFEMDERSQELFEEINEGNNRLILHNHAIGNTNSIIEYFPSNSKTRKHYEDKEWSASSSIRKPKGHLKLFPDVYFEEKKYACCLTLDNWYEKNLIIKHKELNFVTTYKLIDFIWADVNGSEGDLIKGGLNTLNDHTKYLYIEFSDKELYEGEISKDELIKLLPNFEVIGEYNFRGNFGNLLLKNKNL